MQNIVLLVLFILGIVFMQFIKWHTVDEIIDDYIDTRGGKQKLNAIKSLYMEGSRQILGNEMLIKVTLVNGKLYRNDFEFSGNAGYSIVTPNQGWSFVPLLSQTINPIAEDILKIMQTHLDIAGGLVDYAAKGNKAELQGKETIDGKEAYKIKLTSSDGVVIYYIDTKTYLLIQSKQMIGSIVGDDKSQTKELITNYSDYKSFDGIMFPQTIANPSGGIQGGSTIFNTIILNKTIGEDQYKPAK